MNDDAIIIPFYFKTFFPIRYRKLQKYIRTENKKQIFSRNLSFIFFFLKRIYIYNVLLDENKPNSSGHELYI